MKNPFGRSVAVLASLLTLHVSVLAAAPKKLSGRAIDQAGNAEIDPNAAIDNNQGRGSVAAPAGSVRADSQGRRDAPPTSPAAPQNPDNGTVPNLANDSHTIKGESQPGFFSKFMASGAPFILGGAVVGGVIGALVGGPLGFLLGGLLGVIGGYILNQVFGPGGKK